MASVWRAEHLMLKTDVAVKFLEIRTAAGDELRERFLREARVVAQVRHRNVVQVLDFGASPEGRPYMVMEMLAGRTLAARVSEEGRLETVAALRVVARLAAGLGAAHVAGIVHRDVKPENVFLVRDGADEYPKLIDFGISRVMRKQRGVSSVVETAEDLIVGTPEYMSPEQARGSSDLDARSDVYSAALVLYELLTGLSPFQAELPGDIVAKILTTRPPPLRELRPDLSPALVGAVEEAMSFERERRPADGNAFRRTLVEASAELTGDTTGRFARVDTGDSLAPSPIPRRSSPDAETVERRPEPLPNPRPTATTDARQRRRVSALAISAVVLVVLASAAWGMFAHGPGPVRATPLPAAAPSRPAPPAPSAAPEPRAPAPEVQAQPPEPDNALDTLPVAPRSRPRRRADGLLRDPGF
jgi:serine/threonine-protein kinase